MRTRTLTVLTLLFLLSSPRLTFAGRIDPCKTTFEFHSETSPAPLLACPQGDAGSFIDNGWWISITIRDPQGIPVSRIHPDDMWLIEPVPYTDIVLCWGSYSSSADSLTGPNGTTTMSLSSLAAGGCTNELALVVQGELIVDPDDCTTVRTMPIYVRSPDIDASLAVDLVDVSLFSAHYPPGSYDACCDFDVNGTIDLADLALFAAHVGPPGHVCTGP